MRQRSRAQLIERLKRYSKVAITNNSNDSKLRAYLDDAYARVWHLLTGSDAGFGTTRRDFDLTVVTETIELPPDFMILRSLVLNPGNDRVIPQLSSDSAIARHNLDIPSGSYNRRIVYQLEGPGSDWDEGLAQLVPYNQRLRFTPAISNNAVVRISYSSQPPSLADADGKYDDGAQDLTIVVDVITEALEEAIVGYARVWASDRSDMQEYTRASAALSEASTDYLNTRESRNQQQADGPERYINSDAGAGMGIY